MIMFANGLARQPEPFPAKPASFRALVFTKTAAFRHASIPAGIAAIRNLASAENFTVDASEDAAIFNDQNLTQYQVVIFLSTTGDILDEQQQSAFERYIQAGGGFVGIHSATDTEYGWPWYGGLLGAYFQDHPEIQTATIKVADAVHPATSTLPKRWIRTDEWYNFSINPRGAVHVLATLDETTYSGGSHGFDHPISWCQEYDGGRSWYTALGHRSESYSEPLFLQHILGGILYAAGQRPADCGATIDSNFEVVTLDDNTFDPMSLTVAPDGRVLYVERQGVLKIYNPSDRSIRTAATLNVTTLYEDGLLGIALDPDFTNNQWLYLFYSPAGSEAVQHVSRFTLAGEQLDLGSERLLLEIPTQREECCHSAGSLAFDADGNLFISTGDNTNPFASDGFAPIDEQAGRSAWDAQKSAANTNDLRGKILRITPKPDGSYAIPEGNLFPENSVNSRAEIYVMGCRNPFRISVDCETGWLYWGEVGPDADSEMPLRGPAGMDEWNQARSAGNYGWPYCIGNNSPYNDFDFSTRIAGAPFNCETPVNDSPNNTGATQLPPAQSAWIWYPYGESAEFPELGTGGRTAMAGPVYHFDATLDSKYKLPAYYDQTLFIYEWSRNWLKEVKLDDEGNVLKINPFLDSLTFQRPMDMEIGPDGTLYMLEWGSGFSGGNNDSRLIQIRYIGNDNLSVSVEPEPPDGPPSSFALHQNYPNPFNTTTAIVFSLAKPSQVELSIFNLRGQKLTTLVSGLTPKGSHRILWDASGYPAGIYFCRLTTSKGFIESKRLIFLK